MTSNPPPSGRGDETIGSYRVIRMLGSGGMGEVYLAHDDRLERDVAIKRIRSDSRLSAEHRERLRREARAAAQLNHPAIVQVFDIIEDPEGDSIVMEFVEGTTLLDLVREGGLSAPAAVDLLIEVADGLQAAHARGLVHRDLKAENVMVTPDGDARILDFGVAKSMQEDSDDQLTREGMPVGTYRSMAPEQCEGGVVSPSSDLWAMGVLMYEVFAGRSPFRGRTPLHTLANLVGHEPPSPREVNASLPEPLSQLVMRLLRKDPAERPPSASEVADELEAIRATPALQKAVLPHLDEETAAGIDEDGHSAVRPGRVVRARRRKGQGGTSRTGRGRRGWAGWALGGLAVGSAAAAATILRPILNVSAADLECVVVFPLVAGNGIAPQLGEDVSSVIGAALAGIEPLRWIDGWQMLDAESRDNPRALEAATAGQLTASRNCGYFLTGRVLPGSGGPQAFQVILSLRTASTADEVAQGSSTNAPGEAWEVGLIAMNGILTFLIPTELPDVAADFGARPPDAVAQYLLGERAFRRGQVTEALDRFEASLAADSTFTLAAIRGAMAASWLHEADEAGDFVRIAESQPLSRRDATFVRGLAAAIGGDADEAVTQLRAALALDSTSAVAWNQLGEVYRHMAPHVPYPEGEPSPFERALAHDRSAANVLFHAIEAQIAGGGSEETARLIDEFRGLDPDPLLERQLDIMNECVMEGASGRDWASQQTVETSAEVVVAARQLAVRGSRLSCAEVLFRSVVIRDAAASETWTGNAWVSLEGLVVSALARGRLEQAEGLIEAGLVGLPTLAAALQASTVTNDGVDFVAPPSSGEAWEMQPLGEVVGLALLAAAVYPELEPLGQRTLAGVRAAEARGFRSESFHILWPLAYWALRTGDPAAPAALDRLQAAVEPTSVSRERKVLASSIDAHASLFAGDTAAARVGFEALEPRSREVTWDVWSPMGLERWALAQIAQAQGRYDDALNLARGFDSAGPLIYVAFLPPSLDLCVRAASSLGNRSMANRCRTRRESLGWSTPAT